MTVIRYMKGPIALICVMLVTGLVWRDPVVQAQTAAGSAPVAPVAEPFSDVAGAPTGKIKSLLFTPEEVADIRYAINIYRKHSLGKGDSDTFDEEDFLNKLTGIRKAPQATQFFTYPQFFLQSLVYHSSKNWIIWIENQKITQDSPQNDAELNVVHIDQDKVTIRWRPVSMEKVNAVWEKMTNNEVAVDKQNGTVTFTLRPNQTFSSYVMRALEGRVQPVTVDTHNIQLPEEEEVPRAPLEGGLPAEDKAEKSQDKQNAESKREGLGGLIGAYSHIGKDTEPENPTAPQEKKP